MELKKGKTLHWIEKALAEVPAEYREEVRSAVLERIQQKNATAAEESLDGGKMNERAQALGSSHLMGNARRESFSSKANSFGKLSSTAAAREAMEGMEDGQIQRALLDENEEEEEFCKEAMNDCPVEAIGDFGDEE